METPRGRPFRVGIIGLGLMGRRMLESMASHREYEVVCGQDLDAAATRRCAAEFDFDAVDSVDGLLAGHDLDLVYVATPPASHLALARRVLESGRALFLEKPLSVDIASATELVDWAEACPHPAALNFPLATLPGLEGIERELADGTSGPAVRVEILLHFSQWPRTWHVAGDWLAGGGEGGFLREVFSHFAHLTQRVLGPLQVVHSCVSRDSGTTETRVLADFLAGDVPVSLVSGAGGAAPDFNRWTLYCASRSYRLEDWVHVSTSEGSTWEALEPQAHESRGADTQLDELSSLLRGQPSSLPSLRDGLEVMRTVEELLHRT